MKSLKTAFAIFAIIGFLSVQAFPTGALGSISVSSQLVTSGRITYPTQPGNIVKYIVAYGFGGGFPTDAVNFIADHFDLVDAHYSTQSISGFRQMKARNPNIIIIVYKNAMGMSPDVTGQLNGLNWTIANQHEDWFIHDQNGNRVQSKLWGWYLMDPGNTGWRQFYANWCQTMVSEDSIDGIFADDVWDSLPCGSYPDSWYNPWTVPNSYIAEAIGNRWHNDMLSLITYAKQSIGGKLLILNTGNDGDYVNACDGKMDEEFVHPDWYSYTEFHDEYIDVVAKVDAARGVTSRGKYDLMDAGFTELYQAPTSEMVNKILMYTFSSYLMTLNSNKGCFGFGDYWSSDNAKGYYAVFDQANELGSPVNDYYAYQSVYARDFANGKVLVNPSSSTRVISLGSAYRTLDGTTASNITLADHTGIILFNP